MLARFPPNDAIAERTNLAIQIYGRRFYKDQTPVEYLAEFLLVFVSPKGRSGADSGANTFAFTIGKDEDRALYWPPDRIALKLFSFFPASKLDTRHVSHQGAYRDALQDLAERINGSAEDKDEAIRLLQSLLGGFVGVAKNRTWVTYTFLPAADGLLARELDWLHSQASREPGLSKWSDARRYFATDRHNFMARGGELLFLQLAHLFTTEQVPLGADDRDPFYGHLSALPLAKLRSDLEARLRSILCDSILPLNRISHFVERSLSAFRLHEEPTHALLGWVPTSTVVEAHLFGFELRNIVLSTLPDLEKLDLTQCLCCMQVLRTLCFQAVREDGESRNMTGFIGGYAWVTANRDAPPGTPTRKLAQASFERIEQLLFRVLRKRAASDKQATGSLAEADKHGFEIFRRLAKQLGLVIPHTGSGQRFVLPAHVLRFLVAALVDPDKPIGLTRFYERVFAHYGIALGDRQLAVALEWGGAQSGSRDFAVAADTRWIEETLRQGGFLVELSDAVSMVRNPAGRKAAP
jgi:hypothetical protein